MWWRVRAFCRVLAGRPVLGSDGAAGSEGCMSDLTPRPVGARGGAALVAAASGASVAALGGLVVAGWLTVAVALIQVLPGFPPMQYNTALGFMICGAALLSAALDLRRPTALLGSLAGLIGLATLFQYLLRTDLGIDQLLVETYILTGVPDPGRMGPNSALCLVPDRCRAARPGLASRATRLSRRAGAARLCRRRPRNRGPRRLRCRCAGCVRLGPLQPDGGSYRDRIHAPGRWHRRAGVERRSTGSG